MSPKCKYLETQVKARLKAQQVGPPPHPNGLELLHDIRKAFHNAFSEALGAVHPTDGLPQEGAQPNHAANAMVMSVFKSNCDPCNSDNVQMCTTCMENFYKAPAIKQMRAMDLLKDADCRVAAKVTNLVELMAIEGQLQKCKKHPQMRAALIQAIANAVATPDGQPGTLTAIYKLMQEQAKLPYEESLFFNCSRDPENMRAKVPVFLDFLTGVTGVCRGMCTCSAKVTMTLTSSTITKAAKEALNTQSVMDQVQKSIQVALQKLGQGANSKNFQTTISTDKIGAIRDDVVRGFEQHQEQSTAADQELQVTGVGSDIRRLTMTLQQSVIMTSLMNSTHLQSTSDQLLTQNLKRVNDLIFKDQQKSIGQLRNLLTPHLRVWGCLIVVLLVVCVLTTPKESGELWWQSRP